MITSQIVAGWIFGATYLVLDWKSSTRRKVAMTLMLNFAIAAGAMVA